MKSLPNHLLSKLIIAQFPLVCCVGWTFVLLVAQKEKLSYQLSFCELPSQEGTFNQPVNSWSALSFVLVGWMISVHAAHHFGTTTARMNQHAFFPCAFSASVSMIGYSSMAFHGYAVSWGGQWDCMSVLLFFALLIAMVTTRLLGKESTKGFLILWMVLAVIVIVPGFLFPLGFLISTFICPGITILPNLVIVLWPRFQPIRTKSPRYFWAGGVFLGLGFIFWLLSQSETSLLCEPESFFQGHALWHMFCSLSCGCFYLYHAHEEDEEGKGEEGKKILQLPPVKVVEESMRLV